jgi:hypothetical protein
MLVSVSLDRLLPARSVAEKASQATRFIPIDR